MQTAIHIASVLAMVAALRLMGRHVWCKCGSLSIWSGDTLGPCNSQHAFDHYSLTHVEHGLLLYLAAWLVGVPAGYRVAAAVAAECAWEAVENTNLVIEFYRKNTISRGYYGDSIVNSICDVACCAVGAMFAAADQPWFCAVVAVAIEVALLSSIKDSLAVNVWKIAGTTVRGLLGRVRNRRRGE